MAGTVNAEVIENNGIVGPNSGGAAIIAKTNRFDELVGFTPVIGFQDRFLPRFDANGVGTGETVKSQFGTVKTHIAIHGVVAAHEADDLAIFDIAGQILGDGGDLVRASGGR